MKAKESIQVIQVSCGPVQVDKIISNIAKFNNHTIMYRNIKYFI